MNKVVVFGAAVIDVIMKASSLKVIKGHEVPGGVAMCEMLGGKIESEEALVETGGGGTNVAVGLHRLGEAVRLVSRVGEDELGEMIVRKMFKENVDMWHLQRGRGRTGMSSVLVTNDGQRSIVTFRGESGNIDKAKIDWSEISKADWIQISSLGGDIDLLSDLVSFSLDKGIRIGMNPGKGELENVDVMKKIIPKVDFVSVNRMEAANLLGVDFEKENEVVRRYHELGVRVGVITDGKRGASLVNKGRWMKMESFPDKSIDDTGAGDAFVTGAVYGMLSGALVEDVLKMGLASGGSVVTKLGAKEGLLTVVDMKKKLIKKIKMTEEWL